jgi:hypothetical protein
MQDEERGAVASACGRILAIGVRLSWLALGAYFVFNAAALGATVIHDRSSAYYCKYGSDCFRNAWAKRCCREVDLQYATPLFTCAGQCD